jgi:tetratricopeptide (TPR) repeat protein
LAIKAISKALADLDKAIELKPAAPEAFVDRAGVFLRQKAFYQAVADSSTAIGLRPGLIQARVVRMKAYAALGRVDEAGKEIAGLSVMSGTDDIQRLNAVAWFRATCPEDKLRNGTEAVSDARRACELSSWKSAAILDTLAAAEAEAGNFAEAARQEEQALRGSLLPNVRSRLEERLHAYREHKPFRESLTD